MPLRLAVVGGLRATGDTVANIFVSHRGADAVPAGRLADDLKAASHDVWLDTYEIRVGDSIVGKMNEGLADADYVVVCYSTNGVDAPWMAREWASALAGQLNGRVNSRGHVVRILPVVLTSGNPPTAPPAILEDVKSADLAADWDRGLAALLAAIR